MWSRIRNIWHPENFHYHHRLGSRSGHFEGWYVKLVDAAGEQPYALIPGVFLGDDAHAFIQVLDGRAGTAAYHRYPLSAFHADPDRFEVIIAGSRFSTAGVSLEIGSDVDAGADDDTGAKQHVEGNVQFGPWHPWPVTPLSPGIMGPYSFVPFMQCNHGILSLTHTLEGELEVAGRRIDYAGGTGYVEKDWGRGFPAGYVWAHSNHFEKPEVSLTAAVAVIPWLTGAFRGYIIGLLVGGELHRFTTYTGAVLERLEMDDTHLHLRIRNRTHRLEVDARKTDGATLYAPYEEQMIARVAETMTSEVDVRLSGLTDERTLFEGRGLNACLEAHGDIERVLDA